MKIWQLQKPTPVFTYDLQAPVVACQFSTSVASVLVAATSANTLHVFDVAQAREREICIQQVVPDDARLTQMCLSTKFPIVAVGDNRGCVRVFKLSPNLRQRAVYTPAKSKAGLVQQLTPAEAREKELEMELAKLEEYLIWCAKCNAATGDD